MTEAGITRFHTEHIRAGTGRRCHQRDIQRLLPVRTLSKINQQQIILTPQRFCHPKLV